MSKPKYLTFPIMILRDAHKDLQACIDNAFYYCLYDRSLRIYGDMQSAADDLEIIYGDLEESFENGRIIYESIDTKCPKTSISKDMIFKFYKEKKSEFEIISFLAFAAIRSILQKKKYQRITNAYLISRMAGNSRANDPLPSWIDKYNNRYQLSKIKNELELKWGLKIYNQRTRGYFVSFYLTREELCFQALAKSEKVKQAKLKIEKAEALELAKQRLNAMFRDQ